MKEKVMKLQSKVEAVDGEEEKSRSGRIDARAQSNEVSGNKHRVGRSGRVKVVEGGSMMCGMDSDGAPQLAAASTTAPEAADASGPVVVEFLPVVNGQQKRESVLLAVAVNHWARRRVAAWSANNDGMRSLRRRGAAA